MTRLAVLRAGEYFGELALLANARRNATVRALCPVDLLTMHRGDFLALATHGQFFGERLEAVVRERLTATDPALQATDPAPHADDPLGRPV